MKIDKKILIIVIAALIIKLSLFFFASIHAPQGKLLPDSYGYLRLADTFATKGIFGIQNEDGTMSYERFRTPGYPLFLGIFKDILKIPLDGIIFIQIVITLLVAYIIYKTAYKIAPQIALLSSAIILFDPPITISSLAVMAESLLLLFISLFIFSFILYLNSRKVIFLLLSALSLVLATYVKPVPYYLGFVLFFFILYSNWGKIFWKYFKHALIFLLIVYSLLGIWQVRNYARFHNVAFSSVENENYGKMLFRRYARNNDPNAKGMSPVSYYINASIRCALSFMTRPGSLKYFKSHLLTVIGKVLAYPWMVFWLVGFIWGTVKFRRDLYVQLLLVIIAYFTLASVGMLAWDAAERYRVPMVPCIAIISAYGWANLLSYCHKSRLVWKNI
ncbi:MAG: glycosyltransferase family 39 protein [Candidatus Omnitrophica bacterium]|nr:glycosyltransferase family 39 protein [Candidatus Omnitrophota bacterium]